MIFWIVDRAERQEDRYLHKWKTGTRIQLFRESELEMFAGSFMLHTTGSANGAMLIEFMFHGMKVEL